MTAGYGGRRPEALLALAERRELVVVDVRLSPRSRVPGWNKGPLERLLGDRYLPLPAWGNLNYRSGGPVAIADLEAGLAAVDSLARAPLLVCVCRDAGACHRSVLAEALAARGWVVAELDWAPDAAAAAAQLGLFDAAEEDDAR